MTPEQRKEYMKEYRKNNKDKLKAARQKYEKSEKGKASRKRCYEKHREERIAKMKIYNWQGERAKTQVEFWMDVNDKNIMPMFEDILLDREIAEIEIRIKYKKED